MDIGDAPGRLSGEAGGVVGVDATGLVLDSVTRDLYVSNDFGVLRLANASTTWTVAGSGLPMVEVPGFSIASGARLLYAPTHGRSAWVLQLP